MEKTVEFCSPLFHLHKRICDRGYWIDKRGQSGIDVNTSLFGGKQNGKFNSLPKSMKHLESNPLTTN